MELIKVSLKDIHPYENNPRQNDGAVEAVIESIKQCSYVSPIVVDEDMVILAGHTRYKALKKLRRQQCEVIVKEGLTDEQKRKYRILDNKTNEFALWDDDLLAEELLGLDFDGFDFGFDLGVAEDDEVDERETREDEVPELDEESEPVTKLGDIWRLGRHRLMCGDSTDGANVAALLNGETIGLLLTDPPYGINADKGVGGFGNTKGNKYDDDWDSAAPDKLFFDAILERAAKAIIFGGNYFADKLPLGKHWIVWDKVGEIEFHNPYSDCELAWTNVPKESVKKYTVIQQGFVSEEKEKRVHPTQKSVKLFKRIIEDYTNPSETILDVFGGSGTTLIACEELDRECYMMELDPKYCDVIIKRWENLTGEKAVLIDG